MKNKIRFEKIKSQFPQLCNKGILEDIYLVQKLSLPKIKHKFGICYRAFQDLLIYFDIPIRNHRDAYKILKPGMEASILKKYGVKNVSLSEKIKNKKKKTFLKKYGVDNIWKYKPFILENSEKVKIGGTSYVKRMNTMMCKYGAKTITRKNLSNISCSKFSKNVGDVLKSLFSGVEDEKPITYNNKTYFYDFKIGKILIECNGDYWHCNPTKYSSDYYHNLRKMYAKDIWEYDAQKKIAANNFGYEVLTIWESDFNSNKNIINETIKNKINKEG